ncbi:Transcriptional regulatory protein sin3 [Conoideocrella luteorostrata]|uniref:Transcriptional regulatory protein sin3 n=1 Tax=Conoideocrella luteorostrata TaxID=1105319 RepID=A0AAJ0CNK9_9HYPO|nr:Transcriptional regulatory protein sin3 [Conoideocrella luteorostrata]
MRWAPRPLVCSHKSSLQHSDRLAVLSSKYTGAYTLGKCHADKQLHQFSRQTSILYFVQMNSKNVASRGASGNQRKGFAATYANANTLGSTQDAFKFTPHVLEYPDIPSEKERNGRLARRSAEIEELNRERPREDDAAALQASRCAVVYSNTTISKDNTDGEDARNSRLLAYFGERIQRKPSSGTFFAADTSRFRSLSPGDEEFKVEDLLDSDFDLNLSNFGFDLDRFLSDSSDLSSNTAKSLGIMPSSPPRTNPPRLSRLADEYDDSSAETIVLEDKSSMRRNRLETIDRPSLKTTPKFRAAENTRPKVARPLPLRRSSPHALRENTISISPIELPAELPIRGRRANNQASMQHNHPVQLDHVLGYVNKVKNRFQDKPENYERFLEILNTYEREQRSIQGVYDQVKTLFSAAPDLLKDFKHFLPESAAPAKPTLGRGE